MSNKITNTCSTKVPLHAIKTSSTCPTKSAPTTKLIKSKPGS
uniref:Uncharacterized protein n=1 Tax=Arundo donax TaxID=35708 RepID=A0A0A8YLV9_ARUDO